MYGLAAWSGISGESYYGFHPGGPIRVLVTKEWLKKNIQIGPTAVLHIRSVFIPEGDTPPFLSIIQNGLTDPLHPRMGWRGGRYSSRPTRASLHYSDAADSVTGKMEDHIGSKRSIWRWQRHIKAISPHGSMALGSDFKSATMLQS